MKIVNLNPDLPVKENRGNSRPARAQAGRAETGSTQRADVITLSRFSLPGTIQADQLLNETNALIGLKDPKGLSAVHQLRGNRAVDLLINR